MLEDMKKRVCEANLTLVEKGLVIYTWGNVSEIDRASGRMVIKPSGVDYASMTPEDMVVVDLHTKNVLEGKWRPSSDAPTHMELYGAFKELGGIAHAHSVNAVAFAQAGKAIPALGTTHADYFYGEIPCTRELTKEEVRSDYEVNTGAVMIETIRRCGYPPTAVPGILVKNHGPFAWGKNGATAVYHAVVLEKVAEMAYKTITLNRESELAQYVLDKHYRRKHGPDAYYGQNQESDH